MALKDIVEVNITRQTTSVAVAAFNVPLILSQFATNKTTTAFTRARVYGSVAEMARRRMDKFRRGLQDRERHLFAEPERKQDCRWAARTRTTQPSMPRSTQSQTRTTTGTALLLTRSLVSSFADVASWVETAKKFAIFWITDVNAYDPSKSTDLASVLKLANRNRSAVVWHATPAGGADYPDAAWMGEGFPYEPGTSTWAYKTLNGVTPDTLLASQETALKNKNCNYYMTVGGVSITQEGKVASGEYIDIIIRYGLDRSPPP